MKRVLISAGLSLALATAGSQVHAARNMLFIMDSSNSMWGQIDGVAKITIAKNTLGTLLENLNADTNVGLMAYGHRSEGDCADVQLLQPIAAGNVAAVQAGIQSLTPKGKTPIAASLRASVSAFEGLEGPKNIVLISDGVETCDADPCAAAAELSAQGIDVRIHVVGFDLSAAERAQLECIAEKGNGTYFDASDTAGFAAAVGNAVEAVQREPEPEPILLAQNDAVTTESPQRTSIWSDEFDGFDLSENWTVNGPNPDNYVVEEGELLAISSSNNAFSNPEAQNIFQRLDELPRGDWDVDITFRAELQTGADLIEFGLVKDPENYLTSRLWSEEGYCTTLVFALQKVAGGESTDFRYNVFYACGDPSAGQLHDTLGTLIQSEGATITLSKRGRSYFATLAIHGHVDGDGNQITTTTEQLTSLRSPGNLALGISRWAADRSGEMLIYVDRIEAFEVQ